MNVNDPATVHSSVIISKVASSVAAGQGSYLIHRTTSPAVPSVCHLIVVVFAVILTGCECIAVTDLV